MLVALTTNTAFVNKIFVIQKTKMVLFTIAFACVVICDSASLRNRKEDSERIYFPDDEALVIYHVTPTALKSRNREADGDIFIEDLADDEDVDYDNPQIQAIPLASSDPQNCAKNYARHKTNNMCYKIIEINPAKKRNRQNLRRRVTEPPPRTIFQQLLPLNL